MATRQTMPLSVLLLEGQELYEAKKYAEAVSTFSDAFLRLGAQNPEYNNILELRLASYLKLGDKTRALKDGKSMIRHDPRDGRGYLRCAQLELLTENFETARKWCNHGIQRLEEGCRLHNRLQRQLSKVNELEAGQRILSKPADPMASLPLEVVQMILSYFDYKQIVGMLRVAKPWRRRLSALKPLIDSVDFTCATTTIRYTALKAALARSQRPKALSLLRLDESAGRLARTSLERWITWTELELLHVDTPHLSVNSLRFDKFKLRTLILGSSRRASSSTIEQLMRNCPHLRTARFANVTHTDPDFNRWPPQLENLELSTLPVNKVGNRPELNLTNISALPNLKSLKCRGFQILEREMGVDLTPFTSLLEVDFAHSEFWDTLLLPESLQAFSCGSARILHGGSKINVPKAIVKLDTMSCHHDTGVPFRFNSATTSLRVLSIDCQDLLQVYAAKSYTDSFHGVNELHIKDPYMGDHESGKFASTFRSLSKLTLECYYITGLFIRDLISALGQQLRHVVLKDCSSIPLDAVEWARSKGVEVEVRKTPEHRAGGGRQVTY